MPSFPQLAALLLLPSTGLAGARVPAPRPAHIPRLHGVVLTGQPVDLPAGLGGRAGVLVLGFSQSARQEVTLWGRRLAADYRDSPTVSFYEMPVLAAVPRFLRGWVGKKVTEAVPDRAKPHTILVNDDEKAWKEAASFTRDDDAYILLVDSTGTVLWRTEGALTDQNYGELKAHLSHAPAVAALSR